jgi:hypothetical protein
MIGLPDPKRLVETARAAGCLIHDREWKQYQRYLSKHEQQHIDNTYWVPCSFEEFCALRREKARLQSNEIT